MKNMILTMSQWESRVNELFSMAIICKFSNAELIERTNTFIYSELNRTYSNGRRVYTAYMSGYVTGLMTVHRSLLWRDHLEFCFLVDGVLYSTHKDSARPKTQEFYDANNGAILTKSEGKHYWKNSDKQF